MTDTKAIENETTFTAPSERTVKADLIESDPYVFSLVYIPLLIQRAVSKKISGSLYLRYSPPEPVIEDTGTTVS